MLIRHFCLVYIVYC